MAEKQYTHSELIELAAKWLFRDHPIVTTEIACVGEEPDALGFRGGFSTLVECKAHRGDFLADKKKGWRRMPETALGDRRYYCAPKGLISIDELPEGWGLLEPSSSGRGLRVVAKPADLSSKQCHRNEILVLMSILRRVGQSQPEGVSIRCYTYETKNRATVSIETATEDGYGDVDEQAHNTGSPKLPTLVECITGCLSELDESDLGPFAEQCIEVVLNFIARQLRAGA